MFQRVSFLPPLCHGFYEKEFFGSLRNFTDAVAMVVHLTILGTRSEELSNAHVDGIEDAQTPRQVPQNRPEQIQNEHDNSGV